MQSIWAKGLLDARNITLTFQYSLTPAADTKLSLAASNLYRLFVGGKLVGYGPARAAHGYSRLDEYDLSPWAGQCVTLSIDVHSANVNSFYVVEEAPFFAAEITEGGKVIASASDFTAYLLTERVQKVRRFSFQRTFTEIYHLTSDPAAFYAGDASGRTPVETEEVAMNKLLPRYVNYPKLNVWDTQKYVEYGKIAIDENAAPWIDRAYKVDNTQFKGFFPEELEEDSGAEASKFTYEAIADGKAEKIGPMMYQICDYGRTVTGFFTFKVKAAAKTSLYILFDEVMVDKGTYREVSPFRNTCCNVLKYTFAPGEYTCISMEANATRYANVVITEGEAELSDFGMVLYENPDAADYKYDYGDAELNKIVAAAVNTFAQNAVDILTDCPSRERAGWLCDSYFSARAEALFNGNNLVEKSFLENYAMAHQSPFLPEGMLPMCYPSDHNDHVYIPNWTMWYILELRNYVNRTGDLEMKNASRDKVYGLVNFFSRYYNEFGLLENLESWVFIEWSKCNDADYIRGVNYPSNMIWAAALEAAAELYDDPALAEKSSQMKEMIRTLAWNGTFFEDNGIRDSEGNLAKTGHTTETAQYYAFYFGTASREAYPELFELMLTKFGPKRDASTVYPDVYPSNAIVGNYLRLELLTDFGYHDQVLSECRDFFSSMADMTGTLWEHSNLGCSLNHGFASMAAVYIDACAGKKQK